MRTTLTIDDDVLQAAKGIASQRNATIGAVISALALQALQPATPAPERRNGIPLLPRRPDAMPVTPEIVSRLRDEIPE